MNLVNLDNTHGNQRQTRADAYSSLNHAIIEVSVLHKRGPRVADGMPRGIGANAHMEGDVDDDNDAYEPP